MTNNNAGVDSLNIDQLILIGRIARTRGLRGQLKIQPFTDYLRQFAEKEYVYLHKFGEFRKLDVENVQIIKGSPYLIFQGVDTIEKAQELAGWEIFIDTSQRIKLPKNTFYFEEIDGFQIESATGEKIGVLKDILKLPASDTLVVDCSGKEALIPFVKELVPLVDKKKKLIVVVDMPSLWEGGEEV